MLMMVFFVCTVRFCSCLDIIYRQLPIKKAPPRTIVKRKNYGAVYEGAGFLMSQSGAVVGEDCRHKPWVFYDLPF